MKANEFVEKHGWVEAKKALKSVVWCETAYCTMLGHGCFKRESACCVDIADLKRLVESWELVEQYNGLFEAKELIRVSPKLTSELRELAVAIVDVESCK